MNVEYLTDRNGVDLVTQVKSVALQHGMIDTFNANLHASHGGGIIYRHQRWIIGLAIGLSGTGKRIGMGCRVEIPPGQEEEHDPKWGEAALELIQNHLRFAPEIELSGFMMPPDRERN